MPYSNSIFNFLRFYLFIFRDRGGQGEKEQVKHQCVAASRTPLTGDLARSLGMCSNWDSNQQPFDVQASIQSTKPHQPGLDSYWRIMYLITDDISNTSNLYLDK